MQVFFENLNVYVVGEILLKIEAELANELLYASLESLESDSTSKTIPTGLAVLTSIKVS